MKQDVGESMKKNPFLSILKLGLIIPSLSFGLGLIGCSLSPSESRTIRIEFPQNLSNARNYQFASPGAPPTSISNFTCFGINVIGPGIPPDFRLGCRNPSVAGKIGGLAPIKGGAVEVTIPSGAQRTIQLFALQSEVGCPSVDQLLSSPDKQHRFDGLGDPFLVGSGTADVFTDTTISIKASFDPSKPKKIFEGCESGQTESSSLPLTAAYRGYFDVAASTGFTPAPPFQVVPTIAAGATELGNVTAFSPAEISKVSQYKPSPGSVTSDNAVLHQIAGSPAAGKRAVIQLQWEITPIDLSNNPHLEIELQMAGGSAAQCGGAIYDGVHAAIFQGQLSTWMYGGYHSSSTSPGFAKIFQSPALVTFTKSDAKNYIIVNLESSYVSQSSSCASSVALIAANLKLKQSPSTESTAPPLMPAPPPPPVTASSFYYSQYGIFVAGTAMSVSPTMSGGSAPTSYTISPTALPAGLSFSPTSGVISGTPTVGWPMTYYTVTGINSAGSTPVPLSFSVLNPCSGLSYTTALKVWLDSTQIAVGATSGTPVTSWPGCPPVPTASAAQSTVPKQPIYSFGSGPNGMPAVFFDGVDDYLGIPDSSASFPGGITIISVIKFDTVPLGHVTNGGIFGKGFLGTDYFHLKTAYSVPNSQIHFDSQGNGILPNITALDNWIIFTASITNGGPRTLNGFVNNVPMMTPFSPAGGYVTNANDFLIGAVQSGASSFISSKILAAEILVYNDGALTTTNRQLVECYLKGKYGLSSYSAPACP